MTDLSKIISPADLAELNDASRVVSGEELVSLAGVANEWHVRSVAAGRERVEAAIEAGKALIAAKSLVPHGQWLPWLAENFDGSEATAKRYMTLARNRSRVSDLVDNNPDLSIREAVKHLTKPQEDTNSEPEDSNEPDLDVPEDQRSDEEKMVAHLHSNERKIREMLREFLHVPHFDFTEHNYERTLTLLTDIQQQAARIEAIYREQRNKS